MSEIHLTSLGRIPVDPAQDWLTPTIFALAFQALCQLCVTFFASASALPAVLAVLDSA